MNFTRRSVPAWTLPFAIAATAALAIGGSAIAERGPDALEAERAKLGNGPVERTTPGRTRMVLPENFERRGKKRDKLIYGAASFSNPALQQSSGGVRCPNNTQATGGGVLSESRDPNIQSVNATLPFDGGDRNSTTDDGWIGVVDNASPTNLEFGVYVICRSTKR